MGEFVRVARLSDIPSGSMIGVKARGKEILVANVDGDAYAIGDRCTHLRYRLHKGDLRGTIVGPSPVGSNGDTLAAAPRVAGVEVTVYQILDDSGPLPDVGPPVATTHSGSDGKFAVQNLPGGPIVVTFEPPSSSPYAGTWSSWTIYSDSGQYPWWVVLPTK